jgi:hypothetical protein
MASILCTLVAVSALGLLFNTTRWMGIAAFAAITYQFPFPSLAALSLGLAAFIFIKYFR